MELRLLIFVPASAYTSGWNRIGCIFLDYMPVIQACWFLGNYFNVYFIDGGVDPKLYAFNVDVPALSSFEMRLFTRTATEKANLAGTADVPRVDRVVLTRPSARDGRRASTDGGGYDDSPMAKATTTANRDGKVRRVERNLVHVIMTTPGWRTVFIVWNDLVQSWIKSGRPVDELHGLLLTGCGVVAYHRGRRRHKSRC